MKSKDDRIRKLEEEVLKLRQNEKRLMKEL
jgi:hypothetical protein